MTLTPPPKPRKSLWGAVRAFTDRLAGRLLGLTAAIVLAIEVCVFVPALAQFHEDWLRDYESALDTLGTDLKPYLWKKRGLEFDNFIGFDIYTQNRTTKYKSGTMFHWDGMVIQHLSERLEF